MIKVVKTLVLAVLLNCLAISLFAQWSGTNPITTSSKVKIETSSLAASPPLEVVNWGDNQSISNVLRLVQMNDLSVNNKAGVAIGFAIGNNYNVPNTQAKITVKETDWGLKPKMIFSLFDNSNAMVDRLFINWDGNVGIGQSSPTSKLDVNGIAHAREVKVDLTGWEDRVFNKDYNLLPLTDVEKYIEKHHHLPEIPAEAEMVQNGLEVGAMTTTLVKKIEELTLYMIQQQKTNEEQAKIISEQSKKIAELEKAISKN